MPSLNLIFLRGTVFQPPQLRYRRDGTQVCEFQLLFDFPPDPSFRLEIVYSSQNTEQLYKCLSPSQSLWVEGVLKTQKIRPEAGIFQPYWVLAKQIRLLSSQKNSPEKNFF